MFKKIIAVATSVTMLFSGIAFSPAKKVNAAVHSSQGSETWKLVWNDEFNQTVGGAPDQSVWSYDIGVGNGGWGNAERQYYTNSTNNILQMCQVIQVLQMEGHWQLRQSSLEIV